MKLPIVTVLVAATCSLLGCSSSPLTVPGAEGALPSGGGASASAAPGGSTASGVAYPAGPYGTSRGATVENLSFLGWKHPDQAGYDPDGTSGVKLLAINASAVWCSVCRREYQDMHSNDVYENLHPLGLEILGALFQDNAYFPAQPQDLKTWGALAAHQVKFPLVLDPGFKVGAYFDSDATPLNMLIDVRTMTIVQITMGISDPTSTYWTQVQGMLEKM